MGCAASAHPQWALDPLSPVLRVRAFLHVHLLCYCEVDTAFRNFQHWFLSFCLPADLLLAFGVGVPLR